MCDCFALRRRLNSSVRSRCRPRTIVLSKQRLHTWKKVPKGSGSAFVESFLLKLVQRRQKTSPHMQQFLLLSHLPNRFLQVVHFGTLSTGCQCVRFKVEVSERILGRGSEGGTTYDWVELIFDSWSPRIDEIISRGVPIPCCDICLVMLVKGFAILPAAILARRAYKQNVVAVRVFTHKALDIKLLFTARHMKVGEVPFYSNLGSRVVRSYLNQAGHSMSNSSVSTASATVSRIRLSAQ